MIQFDRLAMLEQRVLRGDEAYPGGFYFGQFYEKTDCGTAACAAGWCPTIWPEEWTEITCIPSLRKYAEGHDIPQHRSLQEWFGISNVQMTHLFYPDCQAPHLFGGKCIGEHCTAEQWADNCRAFRQVMGDPALQPLVSVVPTAVEVAPEKVLAECVL